MKLVVIIDVDTSVDPKDTDPHEIAEDIIACYDNDRIHTSLGGYDVTFVGAEWADKGLPPWGPS